MRVKDLLNKYNGEFYIHENVYNEYGNLIDVDCVAYHNGNYTEEIGNREVHDFQAGHFFLNIYLEDK